jgi:hypothetical protein
MTFPVTAARNQIREAAVNSAVFFASPYSRDPVDLFHEIRLGKN